MPALPALNSNSAEYFLVQPVSLRERITFNVRFTSCLALTAAGAMFGSNARADDLGNRSTRMWQCEEYSLTNTTWSGNPYDLVATATFTHAKETRATEMFYVGGDTWKFRFTGTRTGAWKFSTSSNDADLDGHTGSIDVTDRASTIKKTVVFIKNLALLCS